MSRARLVSQLVGANTALGNTVITGTANVSGAVTFANTLSVASNTLLGTTTTTNNLRLNQKLAVVTTGSGIYGGASLTSYPGTVNVGSIIDLQRSRGTTDGSMTTVASGDILGYGPVFRGADGTSFVDAAYIQGAVDGAVSTGIVPGRLAFNTSNASGANQEVMRMDSAGRVTLPYQPAVVATVTSNKTISSSTPLQFDSIVLNRNSAIAVSASNSRFAAPIAGYYVVSFNYFLAGGNNDTAVDLRVNGTSNYRIGHNLNGVATLSNPGGSGVVIFNLSAGDYIDIIGSGTKTILGTNPIHSVFSMYLLG